MLGLGRAIVAEPNTNSQNDTFMQRLTGFIQEWSDLQMAWQNWYNELHAKQDQSRSLADRLESFVGSMSRLEPACAAMFPATVSLESLDSELKTLQVYGNQLACALALLDIFVHLVV